ncbi:CapA family protein [Cryptosporangium minutisporangium]|uniref:Capsule synthesis protein CapA domain-containing protein n=1 Tax=Cryptosporangium minutisporangium TaxID=113569 RepID=A0ABP6STF0_9ACTN
MKTGVRGRWIAIGALSVAVALLGVAAGVTTSGPSGTDDGTFLRLAAPAASTAPPEPTVRVAAVGDVILGSTPKLPPDGGRTFFDDVRPVLTGDVVTGNLESPLTDRTYSAKCARPSSSSSSKTTAKPSEPPNRCFAFRVPPGYARWLADAGFTVLNVANNHARDYGTGGLHDTTAALRRHGVAHTGFAGQITRVSANGVRVAVLGFSPYGWTNSVLDVRAAAALVRRAAVGADVVVVNMHIGAEGSDRTHVRPGPETFLDEQRGDPIRFAHAVVDAGADLVVGHGPHVLRGMEFYRGRLIAYSTGNFAGYRTLSTAGPLGVGGVVRVELRADGSWVGGTLVSTRLVRGGLPARDPERRALTLVRRVSAADFGQTAVRLGPGGTLSPPAG